MREPDFIVINEKTGQPYLKRWWLIPRNVLFNIYLHKFEGSDDDRALHDHPWYSISFLLKGEMLEHLFSGARTVPRFWPVFRSAKHAHRLELVQGPVWTLFITGPRLREWGFYCRRGWVHWKTFTQQKSAGRSRGCGDY